MEAFARALRQLPATIADNAGLDSAGGKRWAANAFDGISRPAAAAWGQFCTAAGVDKRQDAGKHDLLRICCAVYVRVICLQISVERAIAKFIELSRVGGKPSAARVSADSRVSDFAALLFVWEGWAKLWITQAL